VLAGLEAAHAMGIIHRDVKPDNVFVCDETKDSARTVKLLDFGVAKVLDVASDAGRPALPHVVTEEGGFVGTPRIFAPEQALGRRVDARTDVYATGLLLYTLLVGEGPFAHLTEPAELIHANVRTRPVPPSLRARQTIPPALDAAVLRALEKQPGDRFPSASAFAAELRRIARELADVPTVAAVSTGLISADPNAAPERGHEGDRTMQLPCGAVTAHPSSPDDSTPVVGRRAGFYPRHRSPGLFERLARRVPRGWRRRGLGTVVALMLISAAISTILLLLLSRVTP
jgi:serine/threonine protein kinase